MCDTCDTKMQNAKLENMLKTIHELKENNIVTLRGRIEQLDDQIQDAEAKARNEDLRLVDLQQDMQRRREELEDKKVSLEEEKKK